MPHYITWRDFCGPRQPTKFNLPPPNDGVDHVGDLKYGRQDYDWSHPVLAQYNKEHIVWWQSGRQGEPPLNWRLRVRDKWAMIRICDDPETVSSGYARPLLYDSGDLYDLLISTPRLVNAVHQAVEQGGRMGVMREVKAQVESVFRNEFRRQSIEPKGFDYQRAAKFFDYSLDLIGKWLLLHYELYPLWWGPMVAQHAEVSPEWQQFVQRAAEQAKIADGKAIDFVPRIPKNRKATCLPPSPVTDQKNQNQTSENNKWNLLDLSKPQE